MKYYLGIEFGSTRIKAVVIDERRNPVSSGDYTWASKLENGVWTYELDEALAGLKQAISELELMADKLRRGLEPTDGCPGRTGRGRT